MERRGGKDRRKYIDPRYQNAAYRGFVERRKGGDRRKIRYQDLPGHPTRKLIMLLGVVVTVFLIYIFVIASFVLTKKCHYRTVQKKTITFGYHQDHQGNHVLVAIV
ncbi:MAG: hypothetical protein JSV01_02885 [Desulfobacterales bacterium]|nr:MAG: hypothetical protein JSV01_02885 [Desulfobacterales bacterium]UCF81991.1 MAG: hypothetical protein JSV50_12325 [Desulfobacteraceae bacterium]